MNALSELKKRAAAAAIPAIPAIQGQRAMGESQESQESQAVKGECHSLIPMTSTWPVPVADNLNALRNRLLTLATTHQVNAVQIHRLNDTDLACFNGWATCQIETCFAMLADTLDRHAGRIPPGHTAEIHCLRCGPVWVHPSLAEDLPVVAGWPHTLGCPWCFVRGAGGDVPRLGGGLAQLPGVYGKDVKP